MGFSAPQAARLSGCSPSQLEYWQRCGLIVAHPDASDGPYSFRDLVALRMVRSLLDAGLPLVQCLEILATQQENQFFQKVLTGTRSSVEGGSTLSAAMKQYPKVFDPLYSNMVEAGDVLPRVDDRRHRPSDPGEGQARVEQGANHA